jgi:hypothetical protein
MHSNVCPTTVVDDDDEDELRPSKKPRGRPPTALAKHFPIDSNRSTCKSCRTTMSKQSSRYASHQRSPFRTRFPECVVNALLNWAYAVHACRYDVWPSSHWQMCCALLVFGLTPGPFAYVTNEVLCHLSRKMLLTCLGDLQSH